MCLFLASSRCEMSLIVEDLNLDCSANHISETGVEPSGPVGIYEEVLRGGGEDWTNPSTLLVEGVLQFLHESGWVGPSIIDGYVIPDCGSRIPLA